MFCTHRNANFFKHAIPLLMGVTAVSRKNFSQSLYFFFLFVLITDTMVSVMTELSTKNTTDRGKSPILVTNKKIQEIANVSDKTVRRWAAEFEWETFRINSRVIRYNQSDVEQTLGISIS